MRLFFAARRQFALRIGCAVFRFRVSPEQQIHPGFLVKAGGHNGGVVLHGDDER